MLFEFPHLFRSTFTDMSIAASSNAVQVLGPNFFYLQLLTYTTIKNLVLYLILALANRNQQRLSLNNFPRSWCINIVA
jgi:hypothetical protein